jgi:hypothetical protein
MFQVAQPSLAVGFTRMDMDKPANSPVVATHHPRPSAPELLSTKSPSQRVALHLGVLGVSPLGL